ncbi:MAG: protein-L-isoaspartate(D-aspartate) O-methyltransferase [Bacteroidales bacterium]|nr:protein-L-isoaspartate(D-aspartate) O-methyltransferase [Bacteroidales bacterium]MCL2133440.1 protein-L-isoaspartate(D-aspartate) O-methyltransferase [Bacteroidales bacterium]
MAEDTKYKLLRQRLVEQLRQKYPFDERVLAAIAKIPRQIFVATGLERLAYEDRPLPIAAQQTISQPYTVAMQSHLLEVKKWDKVLEIGTGCGYQAAVLVELGAKVYSIERQKELYEQARKTLWDLHYQLSLFHGDGYAGKLIFAPFQKIIVTCGAPSVPQALLEQLAVGGRMVIPVGSNGQTMQVIDRLSETEYRTTSHGKYSFVPMLEGTAEK